MSGEELLQEHPSEDAREDPFRQEVSGPAGNPSLSVGGETAPWHDAVYVGMVRERLAPGVQNRRKADLGAEMLGVAGNGFEGLDSCRKQHVIHDRLVLVGQSSNFLRQREDDMKILDLQQIDLAGCEPLARRGTLTLGAMPIPAAAIRDLSKPALATAMDMPTQSSRSASFNRYHNAKLATIEVAGIGLAVGFAVAAEDIYRLFCQLLFTQAFLFKQLRLFERIAERAIVRAAVKVRPAIV